MRDGIRPISGLCDFLKVQSHRQAALLCILIHRGSITRLTEVTVRVTAQRWSASFSACPSERTLEVSVAAATLVSGQLSGDTDMYGIAEDLRCLDGLVS